MDLLPWITDERFKVARLLEGLSPQQLSTPSLCAGWTVRDVAAHLLSPLVTSTPRLMFTLFLAGLDIDRANVRLTAAVARRPTQALVDGLRERAAHPFKPPGMSHAAPLTDLLVHQQDMRRPLGLRPDLDPDRLRVCLGAVAAAALGRGGGRMAPVLAPAGTFAGLRFEATDLDWARGEGPAVSGPGEALLMALSGRVSALTDVDGEGAAVLRSRLDLPDPDGPDPDASDPE